MTALSDTAARLDALEAFFATGRTRDLEFRRAALLRLQRVMRRHEADIAEALRTDLHKSADEGWLCETGMVLAEIRDQLRHLDRRARPQRTGAPLFLFPSSGRILHEPKGVVLILAPWNYPLQLTLSPLAGAVAAGNCVALKPSATSAATRHVLETIIAESFAPEHVALFAGDHAQTAELLDRHFDHLFFTGGASFGRTVMTRAAEHLTPVTLELGGKSPCIVDRTADPDLAARRIVWGKLLNAGQTCIAPDYLFVHRDLRNALLERIPAAIERFYGSDLRHSPAYPRIVSDKAFTRLCGYLDAVRDRILLGGTCDAADRFIAPTLVDAPDPQSPLMQEEIFGPILPVYTFNNIEEPVAFINRRPKPLALYYFGDRRSGRAVLRTTTSGGACINDTILHVTDPALPFGGIGTSGTGRYHGRASFETFSNIRSVLVSPRRFDISLRYPPYRMSLLKKLL